MRKVIAAFNMTIDGVCDHTSGIPSEDLHQHYSDLLANSGIVLYGRITYELMLFWKSILLNPTGKKSMDDFAISIDKVPKLVFSSTLKVSNWESATLSNTSLKEKVLELKQQAGKDIAVGSRSIIIQLLNEQLIDEFQLCVHPVIEGNGLRLFEQIEQSISLKLIKTKTLQSGSIILYYEPIKQESSHP